MAKPKRCQCFVLGAYNNIQSQKDCLQRMSKRNRKETKARFRDPTHVASERPTSDRVLLACARVSHSRLVAFDIRSYHVDYEVCVRRTLLRCARHAHIITRRGRESLSRARCKRDRTKHIRRRMSGNSPG